VRRRLVVLVVLAVLIGVCVAARSGLADGGSGPASAAPVGRSQPVPGLLGDGTYVVQPGDSMWTIASRVAPGADIGSYVDRLVAMHGGAAITAGERLRLP
jgi:hypothetical protein